MNKISPLDIRVAVLAHPLVAKEDSASATFFLKPIAPYTGDERIVSLFQNSPKPSIELNLSKIPPLLRKGQLVLLRVFEILRTLLEKKEKSTVLDHIAPPRMLFVPQLPHPPFLTAKPPRFFWHPAYILPSDEYAPSGLMAEAKEAAPVATPFSAVICAHIRRALPKKGILKQDSDGFVYLELPDEFITDLFPLIHDRECEAVPLYQIEPSPAHIAVVLPDEWSQKKGWGDIKEIDESFSFEVKGLNSLRPQRWPGVEKVYFLEIASPSLDRLRERLLLPSRIRGHAFHVAIAFKKANAALPQKETYRLNVSCFAA